MGSRVSRTSLRMVFLVSVLVSVQNVAAQTLIGQWLTGSQDYADKSGYTPVGTHDGLAVGSGQSWSTDLPGDLTSGSSLNLNGGGALRINNTKQGTDAGYLNTFDNGIQTKVSVSFWARNTAWLGNWNPWVSKNGETSGWQVRKYSNSNNAGFTLRTPARGGDASSGYNVNNSNWHHFVGVWDGVAGTRVLYIDNTAYINFTGDTGSLTLPSTSAVVLGGRDNSGYGSYYNGKLYDVRIYNAALSAAQVNTLYTAFFSKVSLTNPGARNMTLGGSTADVYATLGVNGATTADVTLYWGTTDMGKTSVGWNGGSVNLGTKSVGEVSTTLSGLTAGTTYYYRFYGYNSTLGGLPAWSNAGQFQIGVGLVGYWNMNEGSGAAAKDFSVYNNNGTIYGTLTWVAGQSGNAGDFALSFPYNNANYVKVLDNAALHICNAANRNATVALWWYDNGGYYGDALCFGNRNLFFQAANWSADQHTYPWSDNNTSLRMTCNLVPVGGWHFVAWTYDGSSEKFYIDSTAAPANTTTPGAQNLTAWGDLYIGREGGGTAYPWTGKLDDILIADFAATPSDLALIKTRTHSMMLRYWTGGGTGNNWSESGNWGYAGMAAGKVLTFDTSLKLTANNNNFAANTQFRGINFLATAGSFTLNGNAVNLTDDVVNNSTATQTIALNGLVLDGSRNCTFNAASGNIIVNNGISQAGVQVNGLIKSGSNELKLLGTCSYTGNTSVNDGTLRVNGALGNTAVTVQGATAAIAGSGSVAGLVVVQSSGHAAPGASASASGALTCGGGLSLNQATLDGDFGAPGTPGTDYDQVSVTGDLTLTGNTMLNVNQLSGFTYGTYDIITYSGNLLGSGTISPPVPSGQYGYQIRTNTANKVQLRVYEPPATKTWDGQVGGSNNGSWDIGTTENWKTNGLPASYRESVDGNDPVVFDDVATGTTAVNLGVNVAPSTVSFNNTSAKSYTLSGTGCISGTTGLTLGGGGSVTLGTANAFAGDTVLTSGTLTLDNSLALAGSTLDYSNVGGTLSFGTLTAATLGGLKGAQSLALNNGSAQPVTLTVGNNSQPTSYGGTLSGNGGLTKAGGSTLTLSSSATYNGATAVSSGDLIASTLPNTASISVGGTLTVQSYNSAAALSVAAGGTANISGTGITVGAIDNANIVNFTGASGTVTAGNLTGGGTTTFAAGASLSSVSEGTVNFNGTSASVATLGDAMLNMPSAGAPLNLGSGSQTSGVIAGGCVVTKSGSGTLILNGANTYSGGTQLSGGTLSVNVLSDTPGATSALGTAGTISLGTGTLQYTGAGAYSSGRWHLGGGTTIFDITQGSGSVAITYYYGGHNVTKTGLGTLTFAGTVYWTGANDGGINVEVDQGTLLLNGSVSDANIAVTVLNVTDVKPGAVLKLGNGTQQIAGRGRQWHGAGTLHMSGGTFDLNSCSEEMPVFDGTAGTVINNVASSTSTAALYMYGDKTFAGNIVDGAGSGKVGLNLAYGGTTWTLSGNNTYSGTTTVGVGTLQAGSATAFSPNSVFTVNTTLDLAGFSNQIAGLTGSGTVKSSAGTGVLTVNNDILTSNSDYTFAGTLQDGGGVFGLTKSGSKMLTLSNAGNTYSGGTIVNGGTLTISGSGVFGSTAGSLTLGGGALDLAALSRTVGAVSVTAAAASGDTIRNGNLTGTSYAANNPSGNAIISAALLANGSAGFSKAGAGHVTLKGVNTFTGETTISAGTLAIGAGGSINNSTLIQLASPSAVLDVSAVSFVLQAGQELKGNGQVVGNVAMAGSSTLTPGNSVGTLTVSGNLTLNGAATYDFELNTPAASDSVSVGGTLDLGGVQWGNFNFMPQGGFGGGTYTLFAAGATTGVLGSSVSGTIGGRAATLRVDGTSLVLDVPRPPSTVIIFN